MTPDTHIGNVEFSPELKQATLARFFTNTDRNVFAFTGEMPTVLAAALTARQSRAETDDPREVFWNEFIVADEVGVRDALIGAASVTDIRTALSTEKARAMLQRIMDRFGDDSVREDGSGYVGAHSLSVLTSMETFAAHKLVSAIEVSTRYVRWDKKPDPCIIPDGFRGTDAETSYRQAVDDLFGTYGQLWNPVWEHVVTNNPRPEKVSERAYEIAVKGKVCDLLRGLLPLGIKTNFVLHGNYRTLSETAIILRGSVSSETRRFAEQMATELAAVNPEFMGVVGSDHGHAWTEYEESLRKILDEYAEQPLPVVDHVAGRGVTVVALNYNYEFDLARAIASFVYDSATSIQLDQVASHWVIRGKLPGMLQALSQVRGNRRHKVHEALSSVLLRYDLDDISFGAVKDLNRQRPVQYKRILDWSGRSGVVVPGEIDAMGGSVARDYRNALLDAVTVKQELATHHPFESRYILPHGAATSFEIVTSLAHGIWIEELRSIASGNDEYRWFAQRMYEARIAAMPATRGMQSFVDMNNYTVGRIGEAARADLKGRR